MDNSKKKPGTPKKNSSISVFTFISYTFKIYHHLRKADVLFLTPLIPCPFFNLQVLDTILLLGIVLVLFNVNGVEGRKARVLDGFDYLTGCGRKYSASLTEFGGVGDGVTSNTKAFQSAIYNLSQYASDGGSLLFVPPGKWLTGSFNLTSHFTLYLHKDATLLASQVRNSQSQWQ